MAAEAEFLSTQARMLIRQASLAATQQEVMLTLPDQHVAAVVSDFCEGALIPAARRRTPVRVLISDDALRAPEGRELVMMLSCSGVALRQSRHPLPDLGIFGRRLAIWRACRDVPGWLCSSHPGPVNNALRVFQVVWRASDPLGLPEQEPTLSDFEIDILRHLVNGSKDECAARALNVSTRTYRRHVTAMCGRLGASSRFEAGAKAVVSGWIPDNLLE